MSYQQKYLKYKKKYLALKKFSETLNQSGGSKDIMNVDQLSDTPVNQLGGAGNINNPPNNVQFGQLLIGHPWLGGTYNKLIENVTDLNDALQKYNQKLADENPDVNNNFEGPHGAGPLNRLIYGGIILTNDNFAYTGNGGVIPQDASVIHAVYIPPAGQAGGGKDIMNVEQLSDTPVNQTGGIAPYGDSKVNVHDIGGPSPLSDSLPSSLSSSVESDVKAVKKESVKESTKETTTTESAKTTESAMTTESSKDTNASAKSTEGSVVSTTVSETTKSDTAKSETTKSDTSKSESAKDIEDVSSLSSVEGTTKKDTAKQKGGSFDDEITELRELLQ